MSYSKSSHELKDARLDVDVLKACVPVNRQKSFTDETLQEVIKLAENPDYGMEFVESYKDHLNILKGVKSISPDLYMNAIKFFTLVESGHTLVDAYIKVFPERFVARGKDKQKMGSESSRYNNSRTLNEIRKVAVIPVQLIYRHVLHEAILTQAELMREAKSEMVRHKAADTLIRELKPTEDHTLNINVEDGAKSAIEELRLAAQGLAIEQKRSHDSGVDLKTIIEGKVVHGD